VSRNGVLSFSKRAERIALAAEDDTKTVTQPIAGTSALRRPDNASVGVLRDKGYAAPGKLSEGNRQTDSRSAQAVGSTTFCGCLGKL